MDASVVVWENWHEQVKQLFIGIHGYQKKTLALCALGIILSGSHVVGHPFGRRLSPSWSGCTF